MSKKVTSTEKGFAIVELALVLIAVGLIAATGWWVVKQKGENDKITGNTLDSANASTLKTSNKAKEPLKSSGKTASDVSKTSVDNILSGANEESSLDEAQASALSKDATESSQESTNIGDLINANNL